MISMKAAAWLAGAWIATVSLCAKTQITFPSEDGLTITADLYLTKPGKDTPFIVLFHQAGGSRGEYTEIAPRLNRLGFNCVAVDARSGSGVMGVSNETSREATKAGKSSSYVDALPDLLAALKYTRRNYASGKLIAWGSSYSASLSLHIAGKYPALVDGVMAFSPGEYFPSSNALGSVAGSASGIAAIPTFITSGPGEGDAWKAIYEAIPSPRKKSFLPPGTAYLHGSSVLWSSLAPAYWEAVEAFLNQNFGK